MGKSKALELHRAQIEEKAHQAGELYWRAFREAINPQHLLQDLKGSSHWQKWILGGELTVVIDGVDEGLALAGHLVAVLTAELRDQPVARLRLILVSRDAEWPADEGRALMKLWSPEQVGRFQLQRLRFTHAAQAARQWGLSEPEVSAFLSGVLEKAIEPFASRPMTLRMLVDEFKTDRELSGTRAQIFRRACLRLCREDPRRAKFLKQSAQYHEFTAEQLLPVVRQVASWMLLGRFSAVSRTPVHAQHLDFERLVPEDADGRKRANIEAALGCALFCDAGSQSRTFAHQSYAEYLAAEHLSGFPLAQVLNLVCIHDGLQRFIAPQLAELAAWLALRHEDFADWLIENEPEILLRNDASSLSESRRSRFVSRFLERMVREEAFDDWDLKRFYASFRHAGLAGQLRPYLVDRQASPSARRAAIHLAGLQIDTIPHRGPVEPEPAKTPAERLRWPTVRNRWTGLACYPGYRGIAPPLASAMRRPGWPWAPTKCRMARLSRAHFWPDCFSMPPFRMACPSGRRGQPGAIDIDGQNRAAPGKHIRLHRRQQLPGRVRELAEDRPTADNDDLAFSRDGAGGSDYVLKLAGIHIPGGLQALSPPAGYRRRGWIGAGDKPPHLLGSGVAESPLRRIDPVSLAIPARRRGHWARAGRSSVRGWSWHG